MIVELILVRERLLLVTVVALIKTTQYDQLSKNIEKRRTVSLINVSPFIREFFRDEYIKLTLSKV